MGMRSKLRSYISDDRPLKLKSYVSSHDIDSDAVKLGHGRRLLHFCALHGSGDMLKCLLRLECDAARVDKDGNLALHLALQRGLEADLATAGEVLSGLVPPLQQAYPLGLDQENRRGLTAHDLLSSLKDKVKAGKRSNGQSRNTFPAERLSQGEDEQWRRKLEAEFLFECQEQEPRYSTTDDDFYPGASAPSFDRWSEQIAEEMSRKNHHRMFARHKSKRQSGRVGRASGSGQKATDEEENLRKAREEMRKKFKLVRPAKANVMLTSGMLAKKQRYERKFSQLLGSNLAGKSLTFACVPWPHVDVSLVGDVLFCDLADKTKVDYAKYLRSQRVRWHPDKFTQKFGEHLHPDHKVKVMSRVKAISQMLNKLESERPK